MTGLKTKPCKRNDLPNSDHTKMLESKEEDVIYIAGNGVSVAQLTLIPKPDVSKRIGIAKVKIKLSEDFRFN